VTKENLVFLQLVNIDTTIQKNENVIQFLDFISEKKTLLINEEKQDNFYLESLYSYFLIRVSSALNAVMSVNYSTDYWRLLIGPWLHFYIAHAFRMYKNLEFFREKYKNIRYAGLKEIIRIIPEDSNAFFQYLKDDFYNLQIYTSISKYLYPGEIIFFVEKPFVKKRNFRKAHFFHIFLNAIIRFFLKGIKKRKKTILYSVYFSKKTRLSFFMLSFFKLIEIPKFFFDFRGDDHVIVDHEKRNEIQALILEERSPDEFLYLLSKMISNDIPFCFIENYKSYFNQAKKLNAYLGEVDFFVSSNAWYGSEVFKQITSMRKEEKKSLLFGIQHGGNYGILKNMFYLNHELSITDKYYTWGWSFFDHNVPMPVSKLVDISIRKKKGGAKKILYGLTSVPRFTGADIFFSEEVFSSYMNDQLSFISSLNKNILSDFLVRPHHEDMGWGIKDNLKTKLPMIEFDSWEKPFLKRLADVSLYICDHLSTTHIESLALKKPTILFWRPEYFPMLKSADPYYRQLKEAGVLYDDPFSAAKALNNIFPDIERWWFEKERQEAVAYFCNAFALTSQDSRNIWLSELLSKIK